MTLDPQFYDWMNATVLVESAQASSSGGYGGRTFAAASSAVARIEQYTQKVQSHDGKEVTTKGRVFLSALDKNAASIVITPTSRLTIPTGYILAATSQPAIVSVQQFNDEDGSLSFYEVLV